MSGARGGLAGRAFEQTAAILVTAALGLGLLSVVSVARSAKPGDRIRLEYEPFTEFRQKPLGEPGMNVSEHGYRHVEDQAPWPPRPSTRHVFVFGGSSTFGSGAEDGDTIPSRLQQALRAALSSQDVAVWNWGRTLYYSTQERILLEQLLVSGLTPAAAVFVDGAGETSCPDGGLPPHAWRSALSPVYQRGYELSEKRPTRGVFLRFAESLVAGLRARPAPEGVAPLDALEEEAVVERWRRNARLVSTSGVPVVLVWEPAAAPGITARLARLRAAEALPTNLLWLADLACGSGRDDASDYGPAAAGAIARAIGDAVAPLLK